MSSEDEPRDGADRSPGEPRSVSGRLVVLAMFGFGLLMTGLMFIYWELYTGPFRPLQAAIAERFPESSPRVIGGRHKSHRDDYPTTLRIIVRFPEDPRESTALAREWSNQLVEIAAGQVGPDAYEQVEIFLMHLRPERATVTWSVTAPWDAFPLSAADDPSDRVKIEVDAGEGFR